MGPESRAGRVLVALGALAVASPTLPTAEAAFPGRNGRIAYVEGGRICDSFDCSSSVSTVRPDGTGRRRFFDAGSHFDNCVPLCQTLAPAYSPAGGRMLVQVCCDPPPTLIIPANNPRRPRALRRGMRVVRAGEASWLPDGHAVVFSDFDGVVRRLRANRIRRLGRGDDPQWSRRGRVAVVRHDGSNDLGEEVHGIYTMSPTGRIVRRVASGTEPDWSPYGQWLLYAAPDGGSTEVRRVFSPRPGISRAGDPAFSPDGRSIVFSDDGGLYVIRVDGSGLRKVGSVTGDAPTWQPLPRRRR